MDGAAAVSIIISAVALLVSIFVGVRQLILQQRVTKIEEARRQEEITSRLVAYVTARFESYAVSRATQARAYRFVLWNQGPAQAEDVSFEIQTPSKGQGPFVQMEEHSFPVRLDPGQEYPLACIVPQGTAASVEVELRWRDGTGARAKTLTLTVY